MTGEPVAEAPVAASTAAKVIVAAKEKAVKLKKTRAVSKRKLEMKLEKVVADKVAVAAKRAQSGQDFEIYELLHRRVA